MLPPQSDVEIPLLEALVELDGQARPKQTYPIVTAKFPDITEEDLASLHKHGKPKWHHRIHWVRQALVTTGDMASRQRGIWEITDQGRARVAGKGADESVQVFNVVPPLSYRSKLWALGLVDIHEKYELQFRSNLLDKLHGLTPTEFEHFGTKLLDVYGFVKMSVTQVHNDGGIDGHGLLKIGLARMAVAVQCKRWKGNVPRPEIDKFRGAIQGIHDQGVFMTTSDFTSGAKEASIKKGAVPVILLNGESIVDLMIEKEFGVRTRPLQIYEDQVDQIFGDDE